ncbi:MAG: hypothetical protein KC646_05430 [Candidatus Cloacimonetes bacterium]|nr:hypothetical protein [Candidatus Cloacimonadota bacterium]
MKIAFDLDDTLIPTTKEFHSGSAYTCFWLRSFFNERLRTGAIDLLKKLSKEHDLWIYTSSLRNASYLKLWFRSFGISLQGIVNQTLHDHDTKSLKSHRFSKMPDLYAIDYLIDDSPGVHIECESMRCTCILVSPSDDDWVNTVSNQLQKEEL